MELLQLLEHIRSDLFTTINLLWTMLGEETILFAIVCLVYWCINKKLAYGITFSFLISGIVINALKLITAVPRPFIKYNTTPIEAALDKATGYSFPSGHTQGATSVYGFLGINSIKKGYKTGILFFLPILLVMFSRMYLGVHTIYDVLGGFIITLIICLFMSSLWNNYSLYDGHYRIILIVFTIISFGIIILGAYQNIYENTSFKNASDAFKMGSSMFGFIVGWYYESTAVGFIEKGTDLKGQFLKFTIGILLLISIKYLFKYILLFFFGEYSVIVSTIPYFLSTLFIFGIYPIVIKKFFTSPYLYKNSYIN